MPRSSAADAAATASRILDVATALFAERGFAEVSVDDVASAASVTRGAVYHHYGDRLGLLRAVTVAQHARVATAVVVAADAAGDDAGERLLAGSMAFVASASDPEIVRTLLVDAPSALGWTEWRRIDASASAVHLRDALASMGTRPDLLDVSAAALSGAMNELALWVAEHASEPDVRRRARAGLRVLLRPWTEGSEH